jgi:hypothetical protein
LEAVIEASQPQGENRMRYVFTLAAALVVIPFTAPAHAQGQNSRWCADYGTGSGTNCGFRTYQQCRATISGFNRGSCYQNPQYPGRRYYR